jgi:carboxypeptidase family protein
MHSIKGTVTKGAGEVVEGALVVVRLIEGHNPLTLGYESSCRSAEDGSYAFEKLPAGRYRVRIEFDVQAEGVPSTLNRLK